MGFILIGARGFSTIETEYSYYMDEILKKLCKRISYTMILKIV